MGKSRYDIRYDLESVQGRLYYARNARRLSRGVVARAFGIRPGTLQNWECGVNETTSVPYDYVKFACLAFEVPISWLLGETHDLPVPPPTRQSAYDRIFSHLAISPLTEMRRRLRAGSWHYPPTKHKKSQPRESLSQGQSPLGSTDETPAP